MHSYSQKAYLFWYLSRITTKINFELVTFDFIQKRYCEAI